LQYIADIDTIGTVSYHHFRSIFRYIDIVWVTSEYQ